MSSRKRVESKSVAARRAEKQKQSNKRIMISAAVVVVSLLAVWGLISLGPQANQNVQSANATVDSASFTKIEKKEWPSANGKSLGPADAKVVVQEFADYQCPYCRLFDENIQQQIIDNYVTPGKIRYEFHHFIVIDGNVGGNESRRAAEASECAAQQADFWNYHQMLYANQQGEGTGAFSDARLRAFAGALGLDTEKFNACFNNGSTADKVKQDDALARGIGLTGTPSLIVNGVKVPNPMNFDQVKQVIDQALASAK